MNQGTTYIITNFGIFTCSICAALHREINHKAKGIGMSNFTAEELRLAQEFGNLNFNSLFMGRHNALHHPIPQNSDRPKMKSFLENKYIRKLFYQKKRTIDEPPLEPESTYEEKPEYKPKKVRISKKEEQKSPQQDFRPRASQNAIVVAQGSLLDLTEEQPKSAPVTAATFEPTSSWSAFSQQPAPSQLAPQPQITHPSQSSTNSTNSQPSLFQIAQPTAPGPQRNSLLEAFSSNSETPANQGSAWNTNSVSSQPAKPVMDMASILKEAYSAAANDSNAHQEQQKQQLLMTISQQHQMLGQLARSALSNPVPYIQLQHSLLLQQQQLLSLVQKNAYGQEVKNPFDSLI